MVPYASGAVAPYASGAVVPYAKAPDASGARRVRWSSFLALVVRPRRAPLQRPGRAPLPPRRGGVRLCVGHRFSGAVGVALGAAVHVAAAIANVLPCRALADVDFSRVLISFVVLVLSLTVHEAAHAWSADRLGDPTARLLGRISLNPAVHADLIGTVLFPLIAMTTGLPIIGWAKPVPVNLQHLRSPRRDFALVALAGPVSNVLLAIASGVTLAVLPLGDGMLSEVLFQGLLLAVLLNVMLAVFNMIPIPPLDGGNVLMGILPVGAARMVDGLRPYGFILLYGLMLTGVLAAIMRPVQGFVLSLMRSLL